MPEIKTPRVRSAVPLPHVLRPSVERARVRTLRRRHGPPVELERDEDGQPQWVWPFGETEEERKDWRWLILDAFGTRNITVAATFMNHLVGLCEAKFDPEHGDWVPDEGELVTVLHLVSAHKPRNEAEAALAAQIAATHLITMRIAKRVSDYPWDTRMVGAFAKLVRANGSLIETMAAVKGKRRSTKQHITVTQERHVHNHQHIHMEGGAPANDRQAHTRPEDQLVRNVVVATLPGKDATGNGMPVTCSDGEETLPDARRQQGVGRAQG